MSSHTRTLFPNAHRAEHYGAPPPDETAIRPEVLPGPPIAQEGSPSEAQDDGVTEQPSRPRPDTDGPEWEAASEGPLGTDPFVDLGRVGRRRRWGRNKRPRPPKPESPIPAPAAGVEHRVADPDRAQESRLPEPPVRATAPVETAQPSTVETAHWPPINTALPPAVHPALAPAVHSALPPAVHPALAPAVHSALPPAVHPAHPPAADLADDMAADVAVARLSPRRVPLVTVTNPQEFSGKTTVALALAETLRDVRNEPTYLWDLSFLPDQGSPDGDELESLRRTMIRDYAVTVLDTGDEVGSRGWTFSMMSAGCLVVPVTVSSASVETGLWTLNHVYSMRRELSARCCVAVVAVTDPHIDDAAVERIADRIRDHVREIVVIPFDPVLASGQALSYAEIGRPTHRALVKLAAAVARTLRGAND